MMKISIIIVLSFILFSCGSNKILVEKLEDIEIEFEESKAYYFGDTIDLSVFAIKKSGERRNLRRQRGLNIKVEHGEYIQDDEKLVITNRPTSFEIETLTLNGVFTDELEKHKNFSTEIPISFNRSIHINFNGENGEDSRDKGSRLLGRGVIKEGRPGRNAEDGKQGKDALPIEVFIWKEGDFNKIKVNQEGNSQSYFFKTKSADITISASGGKGGDGGDGGDGGRGRRGSKSNDRAPGDGGNGGNGGNGADGGDGASVKVFVHSNAADLKDKITVINSEGEGGQGGEAGDPGDGGRGASGQKDGEPGIKGEVGKDGNPGVRGPEPTIEIKDFDY